MNLRVSFLPFLYLLIITVSATANDWLLRDRIDAEIESAWKRQKVVPARPSSDAEFLRRVYLDLAGTIPAYDETVAFLNDGDAHKRSRLVDRLLDDPRFAQNQTDVWDMILFGRRPPGFGTSERGGFQDWLKKQFADNVPYNQWVQTLLRAEGNTVEQGTPMFYVQYKRQPEDATEAITQKFLGIQMQCARCHDHPFEEWSQLDFYGLAAFVARLEVVTVGKQGKLTKFAIGEKSDGDVLFTGPAAEQEVGKKGEPVKPKFLHGGKLDEPPLPDGFEQVKFQNNKPPPAPLFSRKNALADWISSPDNPYLARAIANRIWAQLMGRGIVNPVDNMSPSNDPSHPELLAALAEGIASHNFDLKWYIRQLCNTRTYQLSSESDVTTAKPAWFERARTRPLSAEELVAAWRVALRYDATKPKPSDNRFDPLTSGYMLRFLGSPNNGVGDFQGGLHEHLFLNNGGLGKLLTTQKGSLHDAVLTSETPWEARVEELFVSILNRKPSDEERQRFVEFINSGERERDSLLQAIWVLMTCSEFRFNH